MSVERYRKSAIHLFDGLESQLAVFIPRAYVAFVKSSFLKLLAYRTRYYVGILNYLIFVSVNYFIWQAVYAGRDTQSIHEFGLTEMVTYVTIAWIARSAYFSNTDYEMDVMVRSGAISNVLIRPVNFQGMMLAQAIGESLFRVIFLTLPSAIVLLFLFPILPPANVTSFVFFCIASCFSFVLLQQIHFLTGLVAFYLHSINGIIRAKFFLVQLCSGLLLPLTFFPDSAQRVLELLPFQGITYIPLQFYLGRIALREALSVFLFDLIWVLILLALGHVLCKKAFSKLLIQGG